MNTVLEPTLVDDDLGVCVKNSDGEVLQQNKVCLRVCGNCFGKVCDVACMKLYANDQSWQWNNLGSHVYSNSYVHGGFYDITLLCSDTHMITFLQSLDGRYEKAIAYYEQLNLTKREMEILSYVIKGATNAEICQNISISKATIKTHLNSFYKKIADMGVELKYLPKNRVPSVCFL